MLLSLLFAAATCTAGPYPQDVQRATRAQPRSGASVATDLRASAARLEKGHASDLFEVLLRRGSPGDAIGLSVSQAELVRQLDELAREFLRAWLLRGLDEQPPSGLEELSQRLGEAGTRLRRAVIAHAEAIALEGILTPRQAKRHRALASKSAIPPLPGRYLLIPGIIPDDPPPQTLVRFRGAIFNEANSLTLPDRTASELFSAILDAGKEGNPALSGQQSDLVRRLEKLVRHVQKAWLLRGVDESPIPLDREKEPPTRAMEERLSERGKRLRASIVAHAEAIALAAILTREQAELSKRRMWARLGVRALLELELVAVLHLSRSQRDEIAARLEDRAVVYLDVKRAAFGDQMRAIQAGESGEMTRAEAREVSDRLAGTVDQQMEEHDRSIWAVLRPSQTTAMARLLAKPMPDSTKARPKAHPS